MVEENTSTVQSTSLYRRKVTLPVGTKAKTRLAESRTAVPTGPPGDGDAKIEGARFSTVMVKVWHAAAALLLAQTVIGPNVPAAVGAPARMPPGPMVTPGGSAPLVTAYVAGGFRRVEVNWWA